MTKIKLSTDSTADIPVQLQKELNISVLPLIVVTKEHEYLDGVDLTPQEFYDILEASDTLPTSSQVPALSYAQLFEQCWRDGVTDLIHTSINSKGSGSYQVSVLARDMFYEEHPQARGIFNIHLIDSLNYSMAYGWGVVEAARLAAQGAAVEEVLAALHEWLEHARALFVPLDLRCVRKSGRIPVAAAFVGDALGVKPVITFIDGESKIIAKVRGEKKVPGAMLDIIKQERKPGSPYMLVYGSNSAEFELFAQACNEQLEQAPALSYPVGSVIAINAGANIIGIIYRT